MIFPKDSSKQNFKAKSVEEKINTKVEKNMRHYKKGLVMHKQSQLTKQMKLKHVKENSFFFSCGRQLKFRLEESRQKYKFNDK